ncbi:MAG: DUF418 domain-containing protein, partial [Chloroflexota bacterium]
MVAPALVTDARPAPALRPVQAGERIQVLDILRGFAIFGILLVNMAFFAGPAVYDVAAGIERWPQLHDRVAEWLIRFFAEGKFYTLFSFLFGLGLSIQMTRAEARGARFVPLYARRLFVLFLIGLAHAFLLWHGDILVTYAILGFPLLLFRKRALKTLLWWAAILLLLPVLFLGLSVASLAAGRASPEAAAQIERIFAEAGASYAAQAEAAVRAYGQGAFGEIMAQRAQEVLLMWSFSLFTAPSVLAMFLLGLYAGRQGIVQNVPAHQPLIRKVMMWGLLLGVAGNLVSTVGQDLSSRAIPSTVGLLALAGSTIGGPALCFFYVCGLALLTQDTAWLRRLSPLAAVGRMALTNYLLQSLVGTTIFYSFGLGLYGQVGPAAGLALTIAIYLIQVPCSIWWLHRFQFGPVEWLWRSLTYL